MCPKALQAQKHTVWGTITCEHRQITKSEAVLDTIASCGFFSQVRYLYIYSLTLVFLRSLSNPLQKKTLEFFWSSFSRCKFNVIAWVSSEDWCFPSWDLHCRSPVCRFYPINLSISLFFLYLNDDWNEETQLGVWTNLFKRINVLNSICYDLMSFVYSHFSPILSCTLHEK